MRRRPGLHEAHRSDVSVPLQGGKGASAGSTVDRLLQFIAGCGQMCSHKLQSALTAATRQLARSYCTWLDRTT
jgi:hypothetical protein